ncbi:N-alpha-acetyltransferase 40 [Drosophila sechellia]|uniref:N-alpha-acetyltransferase 40 n=1 Tax=Drosophila sechellia TaxID=7238 RepID=B4HZD3_DROSE|nr:N-alpha-acetyltransferase 40 [Drosophila sechellia]EDW53390.1 GM12227 [Drosophila sechellia]
MRNQDELSQGAKQRFVETAARAKNPLESLSYQSYKAPSGQEFKLICRAKSDADSKLLKWAFKLAETNVGPYYKQLKMGWQPKIKAAELNKNWARYLVAQNEQKENVAYAMFRFDMDHGDSVLYCYEMQVAAEYRRQGLGKFIMSTLEDCARLWHLEKVMLTVLNNNDASICFFKQLGYDKDEISPDVLEQADYQIFSKSMLS